MIYVTLRPDLDHTERVEEAVRCSIEGERVEITSDRDDLELLFRLAVAEGRLPHDQLVFIDIDGVEIHFNERGTPDRWPTGLRAQVHETFTRIRRALTRRDEP